MTERRSILSNALLLAIVAVVIGLDQVTKALARHALRVIPPQQYLGGFFTLLYTENTGAFLSLGANLPAAVRTFTFAGIVAIGLAIAAYLLLTGKMETPLDALSLAFIVGGGVGNLIDRVFNQGHVVDFAYIQAGPLHTGVFNVADVAITAGVIGLAFSWLRPDGDRVRGIEN